MSKTIDQVRQHPLRLGALLTLALLIAMTAFFGVRLDTKADTGSAVPGSPFRGSDGKKDTSPACSTVVDGTGSADNSFTQGAKEDTIDPAVSFGSIPPNKADLDYECATFAGGTTTATSTHTFAYVFVHRFPTTGGTAFFDVEFNQGSATYPAPPNGSGLPIRKAGDLLLTYSFPGGNKTATLQAAKWVTTGDPANAVTGCQNAGPLPCWGVLSADLLAGSPKKAEAVVCCDPAVAPDTSVLQNWEVAIDLTAAGLTPTNPDGSTPCVTFSSAFVKGTSSGFGSALKDFIVPVTLPGNTCGHIIVNKVTNPANTTQLFAFTTTGTDYAGFSLVGGASNTNGGTQPNNGPGLNPGAYSVSETAVTGWDLTDLTCTSDLGTSTFSKNGSTATISNLAQNDTVRCTFTNTQRLKLIIITCDSTNDTLVGSLASLAGPLGGDKQTITAVPPALVGKGVTQADLCALGGASYNDLPQGTYAPTVQIPAP